MATLLITNATLITPEREQRDHAVLCENGRLRRVGPSADLQGQDADEVVDAGGLYLAPGFIDLHLHGTHRFLVDQGPEHVEALCRLLPRYGLTGFLPTMQPRPVPEDAAFLQSLAGIDSQGTQVLGFHLEGPFLTLTGALPEEALGTADAARVRALVAAAAPTPAIFSVAPDFEGIDALLPIMRGEGVPIFMTHTRADVAQAQAAIEAGVRHATHFYDVFPVPEERERGARPCGVVEAVLADERVSVDFILDGEHVDPIAVQMALRCKGPDRVCLITDANVGAGLPPGRYHFRQDAEVEFAYPGGPARGTERSRFPGGLAGSGLTLDLAVRNAVRMLGVEPALAVRMASANPARVLGLEARKGWLREGYDADLVLLDRDLNVQQTWISGRCCFQSGA